MPPAARKLKDPNGVKRLEKNHTTHTRETRWLVQ